MLRSTPAVSVRRWLAAALFAVLAAAPLAAAEDPRMTLAREHLDQGRPEEALELLDNLVANGKPSAEVLLLRSTGRVMVADLQGGFKDLKRALKINPKLRQGWLNLAGLEIAEQRYQEAYEALLEAKKLDPEAADNDLNLGAVLIVQGKVREAAEHFEAYLARQGSTAEAHFLVAANYALASQQDGAFENLRRAIEIDERMRLRARSDQRFLNLDTQRFQTLLESDFYQPPPGAHSQAAAFRIPYDPQDNRLLYAVLEALGQLRLSYDPSVEATAVWGLVWAEDMRIKVYNQTNGTGVVSLSAPAERFTAEEWQQRTQWFLGRVHGILDE